MKAIRISNRQMTLSVFKQLPRLSAQGPTGLKGKIWGWVNYDPDYGVYNPTKIHYIWQYQNKLFRYCLDPEDPAETEEPNSLGADEKKKTGWFLTMISLFQWKEKDKWERWYKFNLEEEIYEILGGPQHLPKSHQLLFNLITEKTLFSHDMTSLLDSVQEFRYSIKKWGEEAVLKSLREYGKPKDPSKITSRQIFLEELNDPRWEVKSSEEAEKLALEWFEKLKEIRKPFLEAVKVIKNSEQLFIAT